MYVFLFQSILCSVTFYDVPLHFNAHAYTMYVHMFKMRAQFILCKYILPSFAEVKVLQQQNMLNVYHVHT